MFISYTAGNSYSFWEASTLSALAKRSCKERLNESTFETQPGSTDRLLKVLTIYGSNASGKSNLFHSLFDMINRVTTDGYVTSNEDRLSETPFFLDPQGAGFKKPTLHELVFQIGPIRYRYGYEAADIVHKEWLYRADPNKKERCLFERDSTTFTKCNLAGADNLIQQKTRKDALFLSVCSRFAVKEAEEIVFYLQENMYVVSPSRMLASRTARMLEERDLDNQIKSFMMQIDQGIGDLSVKVEDESEDKINADGKVMRRQRRVINMKPKMVDGSLYKRDIPFLAMASDGTKKAFCLAGPIFRALQIGGAIFIDELSAKFHPLLSLAIIQLFTSTETNPYNAQLIFTSHDASLLGQKIQGPNSIKPDKLFRRDQICIVEKHNAMSTISRLSDKKHGFVRKDASFDKSFLENEFGGAEKINFSNS